MTEKCFPFIGKVSGNSPRNEMQLLFFMPSFKQTNKHIDGLCSKR